MKLPKLLTQSSVGVSGFLMFLNWTAPLTLFHVERNMYFTGIFSAEVSVQSMMCSSFTPSDTVIFRPEFSSLNLI